MFKENVHRLPEGVVKDFNQLLVYERICSRRFNEIGTGCPRQGECHCSTSVGRFESLGDLMILLWSSETHDDVMLADDCLEPGTEKNGDIKRRQCSLANNYRMNEFDRDMLCIRGIGTAAKRNQTSTTQ